MFVVSIVAGEDWLGVEFRHLAALEAIAREGSFSRAATTLGYTQSAVSSQLATLERLVGARLVERPPGLRQVGLTESGEALLSHARAVHAALEVARAELASRREEACVKIGFFDGIAEAFLPAIVRAAAAEVPEVVFCPREARTTSDLLDRVAEGKLDLALVALPVRRAGIRTQLVLRDPYDLLLPPEHELASDPGPVSLCALRGLRLVLYGTDDQDRVRRALQRAAALPAEALELVDPPTIGALVRAGVAPGLVPRLVAEACDDLPSRPVDPALPPRLIAVAYAEERELTPGAKLLLAAMREVAAEREEPEAGLAAVGAR